MFEFFTKYIRNLFNRNNILSVKNPLIYPEEIPSRIILNPTVSFDVSILQNNIKLIANINSHFNDLYIHSIQNALIRYICDRKTNTTEIIYAYLLANWIGNSQSITLCDIVALSNDAFKVIIHCLETYIPDSTNQGLQMQYEITRIALIEIYESLKM